MLDVPLDHDHAHFYKKQTLITRRSVRMDEHYHPEFDVESEEFYVCQCCGDLVDVAEYEEADKLIAQAWADLRAEKGKDKDARYIQLARRYVPKFRVYFEHEHHREALVPLLRQLELLQTEPLEAIDSDPAKDSYTGTDLPFYTPEPPEKPVREELEIQEVPVSNQQLRAARLAINTAQEILAVIGLVPAAMRPAIETAANTLLQNTGENWSETMEILDYVNDLNEQAIARKHILEKNPVQIITQPMGDSEKLAESILKGYREKADLKAREQQLRERIKHTKDKKRRSYLRWGLMQVLRTQASPKEVPVDIAQAIGASSVDRDLVDPLDSLYEDRGIPSVPLTQNETQELNIDREQLFALREEIKPLADAVRDEARKWLHYYRHVEAEAQDVHEVVTEETFSGYVTLADVFPLEEYKWRHIEYRKAPADEVMEGLIAARVAHSEAATAFIRFLDGHPADTQVKAVVAMSAVWLDDRLDEISVPEYRNMANFLELWGDYLVEIQYDGKWGTAEPTEEQLAPLIQKWEAGYAAMLPEKHKNLKNTRHYFRGIMAAIGHREDLNEAGMAEARHALSPNGDKAFQVALKLAPTDYKAAWRSFWNTGRITRYSSSGAWITSDTSGREQFCEWPLVKWKAARFEVYIPKDWSMGEKKKLTHMLMQMSWTPQMRAQMRQL